MSSINYIYRNENLKCVDCGRKLGIASIKDNVELFGLSHILEYRDQCMCLRCSERAVSKFQDELSFALFGEEGHYNEISTVFGDDIPGYRD